MAKNIHENSDLRRYTIFFWMIIKINLARGNNSRIIYKIECAFVKSPNTYVLPFIFYINIV